MKREFQARFCERPRGKFLRPTHLFNELRSLGVNDILIAVVDGLKGLAEAIETAFPQTTVQTCIVHLIRNSLDYASWKDRKAIAAVLRPIYTAATAEAAHEALEEFASSHWGAKYPTIAQFWRRAWENVIPFFAFPPDVRRVIYTTESRACTCSYARSSRTAVTFRMTMQRSS